MEPRRARDCEILPRQHPITGEGNLLSSFGECTIRHWVGATFCGWDVGGPFGATKGGSVTRHPATRHRVAGVFVLFCLCFAQLPMLRIPTTNVLNKVTKQGWRSDSGRSGQHQSTEINMEEELVVAGAVEMWESR